MKKITYTTPEVKEVFLEAEGVIMGFGSGAPIANPMNLDDDDYDYDRDLNRNLRRPW